MQKPYSVGSLLSGDPGVIRGSNWEIRRRTTQMNNIYAGEVGQLQQGNVKLAKMKCRHCTVHI